MRAVDLIDLRLCHRNAQCSLRNAEVGILRALRRRPGGRRVARRPRGRQLGVSPIRSSDWRRRFATCRSSCNASWRWLCSCSCFARSSRRICCQQLQCSSGLTPHARAVSHHQIRARLIESQRADELAPPTGLRPSADAGVHEPTEKFHVRVIATGLCSDTLTAQITHACKDHRERMRKMRCSRLASAHVF